MLVLTAGYSFRKGAVVAFQTKSKISDKLTNNI